MLDAYKKCPDCLRLGAPYKRCPHVLRCINLGWIGRLRCILFGWSYK